jgi:hypothetical protein
MPSIPTQRTRAPEILGHVQISDVYQALMGVKPRQTGQDTRLARAIWRGGDGFNVSMDDARGLWHDFTTNEGGGILDLVVRVRLNKRRLNLFLSNPARKKTTRTSTDSARERSF